MRLSVLLTALVAISFDAKSVVLGGSNLPIGIYADHACRKPDKPTQPYDLSNSFAIDSYNLQVQTYNDELDRYYRCMKEYLENASNDIRRIREKMKEAVDEAKRDR